MAKNIVKNQKDTENKRKAKNVIMFLGDGMGIQTVTAARMLLGDENQKLAFEKFRHSGLSKTYCVTSQIADSACTATAYLTGVKTNDGMVGINAKVPYGDCVHVLYRKVGTGGGQVHWTGHDHTSHSCLPCRSLRPLCASGLGE